MVTNSYFLRKHQRRSLFNKKRRNVSPFAIVIGFILVLYAAGLLSLLAWAISTSLKTNENFNLDPIWLTSSWNLESFKTVFVKMSVPVQRADGTTDNVFIERMFLNSFLYSTGCSLFQAFATAVVAYLVARYPNPFSKIIHYVVIATLIIPIVGNTASLLQMVQFLHLYDTMVGNWIMKIGFNNMFYLVFYAAFVSLPKDYAESAKVDGANHFSIFFRIMFPMVSPLFWTIVLMLFINYWNDYSNPYLFMPSHPTASLGLWHFLNKTETAVANVPVKVAGGIIVFIPIFVVFMIFRNKLMQNTTEGGIKG